MTVPPLELELRKLGLREKEVAVYLIGLELGPSSVKNIAKKASIPRSTTYTIIKDLEEKGFFTEAKKGKRKYYQAQSPDTILGVLRTKKREIEEKEREFIRIIARLKSKYSLGKKEEIKMYRGKEGLRTLEEDLSFTQSSRIFLLSSEINSKEIKKRGKIYQEIKKRLGKIEVKEVYPKKLKSKTLWLKRKLLFLPDLKGTLILFDKAAFLPSQREEALVIEKGVIVNLLKSLFLILWNLESQKT